MSYQETYQQKLTSADEAVKVVKSGDWVDYGWCACTANALDKALARRYGQILLTILDLAVRGADDRVLELMQEDNALVSRYQNLYAGALVDFEGQRLTLPQLGPHKQSLDRSKRREAFCAEGAWFDAHREEFDEIAASSALAEQLEMPKSGFSV